MPLDAKKNMHFCSVLLLSVRAELPASETAALVDLFDGLGGNKWRNGTGVGRWLEGDPCENRWYGVKCNDNGTHVIEFYPSQAQSGNSLDGTIRPSIKNLSQLQHLVVSNAFVHTGKLSGSIPAEISELKELRCVYLSHNRLSGTIPPSVGSMTKMQGFFAQR